MQKLRGDRKQHHKKVADATDSLRQSQKSKVKANEKANEAMTKLEELHENVEKIAEQKRNLEWELRIKKRECQLLCAMQEKDEVYNQVLQKKIDKKREKIKSLKDELRNQLEKHQEEMIQLQREKEELAWSYNIEKEQVSKNVQLLVSDKEEVQVTYRPVAA